MRCLTGTKHQVEEVNYMMTELQPWQEAATILRTGNKLQLKINCTESNQDDTIQTVDDQFQDDCQSWLCSLFVEYLPFLYKSSYPLIVSGRSQSLDRYPPHPTPPPPNPTLDASILNKVNFPFYQPGL